MENNIEKMKRAFFAQSKKVMGAHPVTYSEMVKSSSTHSLGGGEWSIELHAGYNDWSECIAEFVGSNGQCFGEEPDDLWAEVAEWETDPNGGLAIHHWEASVWRCPDGLDMTVHQWLRAVNDGRLHGIQLSF